MAFAPDEHTAETGLTQRPRCHGRREPVPDGLNPKSSESDRPSTTRSQSCHSEKFELDPDEFTLKGCRYRDDSDKYPLGWPRLAAMQDRFNNMDMFRDFSYVAWRLILYKGGRLAFLCSELHRFDRERGENSRSLTKNQTRAPGHPPIRGDFDDLIAELDKEFEGYAAVCARYREMRRLHPVPREQYRDLLDHMAEKGMLDKEAYVWMNSPDEFVSISAPPAPWLTRFLYSSVGKWLIKKTSRRGSDPHSRFLPEVSLIATLKAFQLISAIMFIFVPGGILLLNELTKPQAFGVLVGFTVVFTAAAVTATHEPDTHKTNVVVCAYMAIMVAFAVASADG
ncbi:hypothetical protein VTK56DRAFT_4718 [Thermocarpiscus australiensis]